MGTRRDREEQLARALFGLFQGREGSRPGPVTIIHWQRDEGSSIEYVSPSIARYGYDPEQLASSRATYMSLVHADDRARISEEARAFHAAGSQAWEQEYRLLTTRGDARWVHDYTIAERDEAGEVVRFIGYIVDVTEARTAQEELSRDRAIRQGLLDASPDLVFYKDLEGCYLGCNAAFLGYAGVPRETLIGKTDLDLFAEPDANWYRTVDRKVIESGQPITVEEWVPFPDGRRLLYETVKTIVRDEAGRPLCLLGIARDITARKLAEEALQRANETLEQRVLDRTAQLTETITELQQEILQRIHVETGLRHAQQQQRALLDSIADLAWVKDAKGRILAVNRPMATHAGIEPEKMIGRTVHELFPLDLAERYDRDDRDVMALQRSKRIIERLVGQDGREGWFETLKTPIFDERGEVIGTAGVARQVTQREESEEFHRRFTKEVDALVRERTAQLERANAALVEELREARKR